MQRVGASMNHTGDTCEAILQLALQIKYDLSCTLLSCAYFGVRKLQYGDKTNMLNSGAANLLINARFHVWNHSYPTDKPQTAVPQETIKQFI